MQFAAARRNYCNIRAEIVQWILTEEDAQSHNLRKQKERLGIPS